MFLIVSCIYDNNNKKLLGYRAVDTQQGTTLNLFVDKEACQKYKAPVAMLSKMQFVNAVYDDFFDRLTSTGTTSISDYPHISAETYGILTNNALTVLAIIDDVNGQEIGVMCFTALGERLNYSFSDFKKATARFTCTNYVLNGERPMPNNGSADFPHIKMQAQTGSRIYQSAKGEQKPVEDNSSATVQPQPKRRGRPPKNPQATQPVVTPPATTTTVDNSVVQPQPKRRGRPPKNPQASQTATPPVTTATFDNSAVQPQPKRRGRPPKNANTVQAPVLTSDMTAQQQVKAVADALGIDLNNPNAPEIIGVPEGVAMPVSVGRMSDDKQGPYKVSKDPNGLPTLGVYSLDALKRDSDVSNSAQQKMYSALMNLRKLAPYYSTIYEAIDKKMVPGFGTFGVTEKKMIYDYTLPAELSVGEISFILIHEMMHICMLHSVRKGGRHPELWNIATDLYINSIICHDFEISFGGPEKKFPNGAVIKCPPFGIFLETIDECLDLSKDTPEGLYKRLYEENQQQNSQNQQGQQGQQGSQQGQQGSQQGQQGQQGSQQGQQGQQGSQQGQQGQQGSQQGQDQNNQGNGQQGQNGNQNEQQGNQGNQGNQQGQSGNQSGQGQQSGSQTGSTNGNGSGDDDKNQQGKNKSGKGNKDQNQQNNENGDGNSSEDNSNQNNQNQDNGADGDDSESDNPAIKEVSVTYNGKKITGRVMMDICTEKNDGSKESRESNVMDAKQTLAKIDTKLKMAEEKIGEALTKDYGIGGSLTQRNIEFGLAEGINWKALMKNICVSNPKKMYIMSRPNKNRMNLGMTMATRQKIGEPQRASNFVVAIDVSGSVSDEKIQYFLSEVNALSKKYDVEGELIYWSTEVGDAGPFSTMKDLLKIQPKTTYGTNVKCVFDYLTGKTKTMTGKTEEMKVRDIRGVFIITDGVFAENYGEYADYFDRRVVWLIDGNPITFNKLFGKVLGLDDEESKSE